MVLIQVNQLLKLSDDRFVIVSTAQPLRTARSTPTQTQSGAASTGNSRLRVTTIYSSAFADPQELLAVPQVCGCNGSLQLLSDRQESHGQMV